MAQVKKISPTTVAGKVKLAELAKSETGQESCGYYSGIAVSVKSGGEDGVYGAWRNKFAAWQGATGRCSES